MKDLLRVKGILKDEKRSTNILQPKTCPHCREPNRPDAQFCAKCNFVMSFEAYQKGMEEGQRKDQELIQLREQVSQMRHNFELYDQRLGEVLEKVKNEARAQEEEEKRLNIFFDKLYKILPTWSK